MSVEEDFDKAAANLRRAVDDAEIRISDAAPNQRPAMERKLAEALSSVEHLQPLGARSRDLSEAASAEGIYSAQNVEGVNSRFALEGRDKLALALDGTGINPVEVEARMRLGANSAALETRWVQQDLQAVADLRGLDLRDAAQLEQAIAVVDAAHDRVAADYGVDDAIHQRAAAQRGVSHEQGVNNVHPIREQLNEVGRIDADPDANDQLERSLETEALEYASGTSIGSRDGIRHDHSDLKQHASPVGADDERKLREAVEKALTREELAALKNGDASVLRGVGDRQDQLTMARDYLRATNDPGAQQGIERVSDALTAERDRVRQERGHEGSGHE